MKLSGTSFSHNFHEIYLAQPSWSTDTWTDQWEMPWRNLHNHKQVYFVRCLTGLLMTVLIGVKIGSWGGDRHQVHPFHRFAIDKKTRNFRQWGAGWILSKYMYLLCRAKGIRWYKKKWGGIEGVKNVRLVQYKLQ